MEALFEIDGYHAVLAHVQNVYPVEKDRFLYEWGFKYTTGIFEFFSYETKKEAAQSHDAFIKALNLFWEISNQRVNLTDDSPSSTRAERPGKSA